MSWSRKRGKSKKKMYPGKSYMTLSLSKSQQLLKSWENLWELLHAGAGRWCWDPMLRLAWGGGHPVENLVSSLRSPCAGLWDLFWACALGSSNWQVRSTSSASLATPHLSQSYWGPRKSLFMLINFFRLKYLAFFNLYFGSL